MSYLKTVLTATVDMTGFNAGMAGLIHKCRLSAPVVVKKEAGELIKELVLRSPPKSQKTTKENISKAYFSRFDAASYAPQHGTGGAVGPSGIQWTRHTKRFLYGYNSEHVRLAENDIKGIVAMRHRLTPKGRQILAFIHKRKVQRVLMSQRVYVEFGLQGIAKAVKHVQKNVGRLKAGWLVSVARGPVVLSGGKMPPKWVSVHASNARGRFEDGLSIPNKPTFLIANSAKGITQKGIDFIVRLAVKSRAAAMVTNARLMFSGKKRLADYAK